MFKIRGSHDQLWHGRSHIRGTMCKIRGTPHQSSFGRSNFVCSGNGSGGNSPKAKGKFLKKTSSVLQLYNSVLSSLRTISKSNEDIMPELTKKFFEKILRESEKNEELQEGLSELTA